MIAEQKKDRVDTPDSLEIFSPINFSEESPINEKETNENI